MVHGGRSLLGIRGESLAWLRGILERALTLPRRAAAVGERSGFDRKSETHPLRSGLVETGEPTLAGRTIATVFFEDSTRTRTSFTLAGRRLGAEVVDLSTGSSSLNKGESVVDTARTLAAMGVDAMVVRSALAGAPGVVARAVPGVSVINAGDGRHEHPTQALSDALTIAEAFGRGSFDFSGLRVAIVGDVGASRVARSNVALLTGLGAAVVCAGPPGLVPRTLEGLGCQVCWSMDEAIASADVVMMLRIQFERQGAGRGVIASKRAYRGGYGLTVERAARLGDSVVVMHPGPVNRGVEMDAAVADGERSLILRQVENGVRVRMAVLEACCGRV